jgi:hypothetical protein
MVCTAQPDPDGPDEERRGGGYQLLYPENDSWKECEDFLPTADATLQRVRRPKTWRDAASQLPAALERVKAWRAARQAFALRPTSTVVRDPAVDKSCRHAVVAPLLVAPPPEDKKKGAAKSKAPRRRRWGSAKGKSAKDKRWEDLSTDERAAAAVLGYDETAWMSCVRLCACVLACRVVSAALGRGD